MIHLTGREADLSAFVALNQASVTETAPLDDRALRHLLGTAFAALAVGPAAALLIALDQTADYGSPNFLWFRARYGHFVYVDRVIVAANHRRQGLAERLYDDLEAHARASGHTRLVCEVNVEPPNPGSDAFHAARGFVEVGRATLANGKTVRYLSCDLT